MKVLVTGASGFVGSHMVRHLLAEGHEVIGTSDTPFQIEGVAFESIDVTRFEQCETAIARHKPEGVINLAGQAGVPRSWDEPELTLRVNTIGTANLLAACRQAPETRILLVGSGQQYAPPIEDRGLRESDPLSPTTPYAVSKISAEQMAWLFNERFGIQVICARPFNHTGPGQRGEFAVGSFCSQIVAIETGEIEKKMTVGNLSPRRDFVDVRDVVRAYELLLLKAQAGEAYNVCSGVPITIRSVLDTLLDEAGLAATVEVVEDPDPRQGDVPTLYGDPGKLQSVVGWQAQIPLERSLSDTLAWYRTRPEMEEL